MSGEAIEIPKSLRLEVCPHCAYSLNGLPPNGKCPECGQKYDSMEVVLYGYGAGRHENATNAKRSRILWTIGNGSFGFLMIIKIPELFRFPISLIGLLAVLACAFAYHLLRRTGTRHPGMVQVRFNAAEFVQYDDLSESSEFWEFISCNSAILISIATLLALLALHSWAGLPQSMAWGFIGFLTAIGAGVYNYSCRQALPKVRDGSALNLKIAMTKSRSWPQAFGFSLEQKTDEIWRLRIFSSICPVKNGWEPIDAEIRCTPEQAEDLHQLLMGWTNCKTFSPMSETSKYAEQMV